MLREDSCAPLFIAARRRGAVRTTAINSPSQLAIASITTSAGGASLNAEDWLPGRTRCYCRR